MITEAILIALITGGCAVISNVIISVTQGSKTLYRIDQLEKKVEKHNNLVERMVVVEENEKAQWKSIDDLRAKLP